MRLIYADEAKKNACKWECGGDPSCPYSKSNGITHEQCEFMRAIDECRTIDAVPVVHAKILNPNPYGLCSNCNNLIDIRDEFNYCPKCGAMLTKQMR